MYGNFYSEIRTSDTHLVKFFCSHSICSFIFFKEIKWHPEDIRITFALFLLMISMIKPLDSMLMLVCITAVHHDSSSESNDDFFNFFLCCLAYPTIELLLGTVSLCVFRTGWIRHKLHYPPVSFSLKLSWILQSFTLVQPVTFALLAWCWPCSLICSITSLLCCFNGMTVDYTSVHVYITICS